MKHSDPKLAINFKPLYLEDFFVHQSEICQDYLQYYIELDFRKFLVHLANGYSFYFEICDKTSFGFYHDRSAFFESIKTVDFH